jgi:hypothetical protein
VNGFIEMYARHYSADGVALGPVTRLDTQPSSSLAIASDLHGGYVATWMHLNGGLAYDLFGLGRDASGAMVGGEYKVNQYSSRPINSDVAGLPSGSVFVWTHTRALGLTDVMARVFNTSGLPIGDQFRVGSGGVDARVVAAQIRNICTDFVAVEVPIRGKAGKLKLKSVARSYDMGSDTDALALTCLTSAP